MNITAFAAQPDSRALYPGQASVPVGLPASVPVRSPATSIILAEAVRRRARANEAKNATRAIARFIRFLPAVIGPSEIESDAQVSLALTPAGPLVYQWRHPIWKD
jgi:hypothetical protein